MMFLQKCMIYNCTIQCYPEDDGLSSESGSSHVCLFFFLYTVASEMLIRDSNLYSCFCKDALKTPLIKC